MPTPNIILSPKYSLGCCCFHTNDADININNGGNDSDYHRKDHKSYQAPEGRKTDLGVLGKKVGIIIFIAN